MSKQKLIIYSAMLALGSGSLVTIPNAYAFDMGDMMSPNKWFGGKKDRYYDDYYYDRYYGGPYGGYGPYGGWGGPYGYGPYGYGYPYGYGAPGYQQQQQSSEPPPPPLPQ